MPSPDYNTPLELAGITYVHAVKYFTKGIASDGPYFKVEYTIDDWTKSNQFVNALLGIGLNVYGPHRHPLSPNLICTEAHAEGRGPLALSASGLPQYLGGAIVSASYKNPAAAFGAATTDLAYDDPWSLHQIDPDTPIVWCTQELDYEVETLAIPDSYYKWAGDDDTKKCNIQFQMDVHVTVLNLTFHRREFLPMDLVRAKRGRINSAVFLGAQPETVLFIGGKTRRAYSTDGTLQQQVHLVFRERDHSWNKFLRPETMAWEYIEAVGGGERRYKKTDLRPLIAI